MQRGVSDADLLSAMLHVVMPAALEFQPDMVVVSAGFDAAAGDVMGECGACK